MVLRRKNERAILPDKKENQRKTTLFLKKSMIDNED
jgi:hypothetical protein